jgi:ligand-binding sensor domain-containing protein
VTVRAIAQDSRGFLWFGTQDGLNRFDGHEFHVFRNDSADSTTLPDNYILSLAAGDDGTMWIGTNAGGLARYDATRESFTTWRHRDGDDASLGADNVYALWQSPAGRLWIGSGSGRPRKLGCMASPVEGSTRHRQCYPRPTASREIDQLAAAR